MRRLTSTRHLFTTLIFSCASFPAAMALDFDNADKPILFDAVPGELRHRHGDVEKSVLYDALPPTDPDRSQEMILAWDAWHKRVATEIYDRFNRSAQANFKHSAPLSCKISYMVARDGRIGNVRVIEPSNNPSYNTLIITVIKSIAGNPVLEYPTGSKRQFVEKSGTFTWNYPGDRDLPAAPKPQIGPKMLAK